MGFRIPGSPFEPSELFYQVACAHFRTFPSPTTGCSSLPNIVAQSVNRVPFEASARPLCIDNFYCSFIKKGGGTRGGLVEALC
jgi:hypothetical protein